MFRRLKKKKKSSMKKEKVKTKRKWVVDSVEMNKFPVEVDKICDLLVQYDEERNHYEVC